MKKIFTFMYIALSIGIFAGVCHGSGDAVRIDVMTDKTVYRSWGDLLTLSVSVANLAEPVTADVHIGIIAPGGEPIYEWPDLEHNPYAKSCQLYRAVGRVSTIRAFFHPH